MARSGGYVVLCTYPSSSSSAIYEVRRGGDGVLYCTCRGWVSNLNAQKRQGNREPAQCKHTRDYASRYPGTVYGPQWAPKVSEVSKVAPASARRRPIAPPSALPAPAPANWRDLLLREKREAEARGVATPAVTAAAFLAEISHLDLDGLSVAEPARPSAACSPELDIE